jgi:hypothetical protein
METEMSDNKATDNLLAEMAQHQDQTKSPYLENLLMRARAKIRELNTRAAPKVKALEWEGKESDCYLSAETPIGTYGVMIQYSDEWVAEFDAAADKLSPKGVSPICSSMDQAKAAAQSHYEKLILEALE